MDHHPEMYLRMSVKLESQTSESKFQARTQTTELCDVEQVKMESSEFDISTKESTVETGQHMNIKIDHDDTTIKCEINDLHAITYEEDRPVFWSSQSANIKEASVKIKKETDSFEIEPSDTKDDTQDKKQSDVTLFSFPHDEPNIKQALKKKTKDRDNTTSSFSNSDMVEPVANSFNQNKALVCSESSEILRGSHLPVLPSDDISTSSDCIKQNRETSPNVCSVCGKTFDKKRNLTVHLRMHLAEKPYKCLVCQKGFIQSGHLSEHLRIHSGEKPFKCTVCEKRFTSSRHISEHMRIHSGKKPFECDICGKQFAHSRALSRHRRIHSGKKPFVCNVCGKCFADRGYLSKHMRIHTM